MFWLGLGLMDKRAREFAGPVWNLFTSGNIVTPIFDELKFCLGTRLRGH